MNDWQDGLRPNLARLAADIKRYRTAISRTDAPAEQPDAESFPDILRILATHVYRTGSDLAEKINVSQGPMSLWMSGKKTAPVSTQVTVLDAVIEDLDDKLAAKDFVQKNKAPSLKQAFETARKDYLETLRDGIDTILARENDIDNDDFLMVLTAAQAHLYPEKSTKELGAKFNTSAVNYMSWSKGESAPRYQEARQQIFKTINADIDLSL